MRKTASLISHLRSHIFLSARKISPPISKSRKIVERTLNMYGLQDSIHANW